MNNTTISTTTLNYMQVVYQKYNNLVNFISDIRKSSTYTYLKNVNLIYVFCKKVYIEQDDITTNTNNTSINFLCKVKIDKDVDLHSQLKDILDVYEKKEVSISIQYNFDGIGFEYIDIYSIDSPKFKVDADVKKIYVLVNEITPIDIAEIAEGHKDFTIEFIQDVEEPEEQEEPKLTRTPNQLGWPWDRNDKVVWPDPNPYIPKNPYPYYPPIQPYPYIPQYPYYTVTCSNITGK